MSAATTAAIVATAATAASGVVSAIGQSRQAQAQASQANYQAQLARNNQQIADWNAERALQRGQVAEQQQRAKTASLIGSQRAALASQGGDVDSGSPLDIQTDTARAGEFDAQTIRNNAAMDAYGYKVQAANTGAQAGLDDFNAANATDNLPFTIGSSLLGTAGALTGKWADCPQRGSSRTAPANNQSSGDFLPGPGTGSNY